MGRGGILTGRDSENLQKKHYVAQKSDKTAFLNRSLSRRNTPVNTPFLILYGIALIDEGKYRRWTRKTSDIFIFHLTFSWKGIYYSHQHGVLAQLARAPHWQCGGQEFKSPILHHWNLCGNRQYTTSVPVSFCLFDGLCHKLQLFYTRKFGELIDFQFKVFTVSDPYACLNSHLILLLNPSILALLCWKVQKLIIPSIFIPKRLCHCS